MLVRGKKKLWGMTIKVSTPAERLKLSVFGATKYDGALYTE